MTNKLYYSDPYLTCWETEIKEITREEEKYIAVLEATAFYPEGGGQPSDRGTIDGAEVVHVYEKDDTVYHVLTAEPQNSKVSCKIDFSRRFDHMQQHSGEHLLASTFFNLYKAQSAGFHMGEDYVSIDISLDNIPDNMLREVENTANENIYKNLDIKTYTVTKEKSADIPFRKRPPDEEDIRVVEIDKVDHSPCCGTHVKKTGEIGLIKIIKAEKYKGMTRVCFKCGRRALEDFQNKHDIISNISSRFSTSEDRIVDKIEKDALELRDMKAEARRLKEKLYKFEILALKDLSQSEIIAAHYGDRNFADIQLMAEQAQRFEGLIFILSSTVDNRLLLCRSSDIQINCGKIFKEHLPAHNGKGGGNNSMAQATFQSTEDMLRFEGFLKELLSKK